MSILPAGSPGVDTRWRLPTLRPNGFGSAVGGLRVEVAAAADRRPEPLVEFVDQWHSGRYVQLRDIRIADVIEVLDQRAQRVAVRHYQHGPPEGEVGNDLVMPVREHPGQHVAQTLGPWQ